MFCAMWEMIEILTAAKFERTSLRIHRKILKIHRTASFDCKPAIRSSTDLDQWKQITRHKLTLKTRSSFPNHLLNPLHARYISKGIEYLYRSLWPEDHPRAPQLTHASINSVNSVMYIPYSATEMRLTRPLHVAYRQEFDQVKHLLKLSYTV